MRAARYLFALFCIGMILLLSACGSSTKASYTPPGPTPRPTATPSPTPSPTPAPTPSPTPIPAHSAGLPARLVIPAIGVDAPVENVDVVANGNLATPTQNAWDGVGWYSVGPRPGENGSAVIDGHLDRPGGAPAVFWNLRYMQPGELVKVVDALGNTVTFSVTRVASYPPQDAPRQDIFVSSDNDAHLNLITCAGYWVPSEHQTTLRLVVYTTKL